jgi:glycosyltransferase involved in cell wall biosynthesis
LNRYKTCVYTIAKDEEKFVDRWMDSMGEADLVVVLDTGSSDGTVERLRARGAAVYEERIVPWRFDVARNAALMRVPEGFDICASIDLDEVFEAGWRQKLEDAWQPEHTRARYTYIWSHHADGSPDRQFLTDKIHRRSGYRWVHPVHEVLEYDDSGAEKTVSVSEVVLHHYQDPAKSRGQYLPLLELSVAENPLDAQAVFWLGREYMFHGMHDACIGMLLKYLSLPAAQWDEERSAAMRYIAESYQAKGQNAEARSWLFRAIAECQGVREPFLALVKLAHGEENWPLAYAMIKKALAIPQPNGSYLGDPECWGAAFYDYGAIAAFHLGLVGEAFANAFEACARSPGDERLAANLEFFRKALSERGAGITP